MTMKSYNALTIQPPILMCDNNCDHKLINMIIFNFVSKIWLYKHILLCKYTIQ